MAEPTQLFQPPRQLPEGDLTFFHKDQVRVGTRFRYFGRRDPNTIWEVTRIRSYKIVHGQYRGKNVDRVTKLDDDLEVTKVKQGRREVMEMTFSYFSYSAIWRLEV